MNALGSAIAAAETSAGTAAATVAAATAAAAAAVATATAAAAAAIAAATTGPAAAHAAAGAAGALDSLVALDGASIQGGTVHGLHRRLGLFVIRESDESETTATPRFAVLHHDSIGDSSELFERRAQGICVGIPRQSTNEQLH